MHLLASDVFYGCETCKLSAFFDAFGAEKTYKQALKGKKIDKIKL